MASRECVCRRSLKGVTHSLFLRLLVWILVIKAGKCAIEITSGPKNVTAYVGDTVQFNCIYRGTFDVPSWYIGGRGYPIDGLPRGHSYRNQILTVSNIQMTDSGHTYQCSFFEPVSRIATLTVSIQEGEGSNITATSGATGHTESVPTAAVTRQTAAMTRQTAAVTRQTAAVTRQTAAVAATDRPVTKSSPTENLPRPLPDGSTKDRTLVIVCASAIAVVVVVCLSFLVILSVVLRRKYIIITTTAKRPVVVVPVINTVVSNDHEEVAKSYRPYIIIPGG